MTPMERIFFLYHLSEIDRITLNLIDLLADCHEGIALESSDAGKLASQAFFAVLDEAKPTLSPRFLPDFRVAYDLATVIAAELGLEVRGGSSPRPKRLPRPPKVFKKTGPLIHTGVPRKKPNKNADHQTIPRFEQLVDLGFLKKTDVDMQSATPAQRRWRYKPTVYCKLWRDAKHLSVSTNRNWFWAGFAKTVLNSILRENKQPGDARATDLIRFFSDAYEAVKRPIGHTPLESVALYGMLHAAVEGYVIEIEDFHRMMLTVKKDNLLPDHCFFASGNDIDSMFINCRRGYRERLLEVEAKLSQGARNECEN
ncbi:MAG TPA: hypothetical protein VLY23_05460 [Candidatus Acidoferrum sp.]|nr:hypothetical protein [Candidatus Acidoferrum sp.]